VELRAELANHPETFVTAMTEKLMMYSVNRPLEYFDRPQVRKVVRDAKKDNYTFASLVLGIVNTDAFRKQGPVQVSKAAPANVASKSTATPTGSGVASEIKAATARSGSNAVKGK
jgi:hypothetical protein